VSAGIRCEKEQPVRFRILGPLEVIGATGRLSFAPRQRIVFSMLLPEPNRAVSVERLVDAVRGTAPPSTAREQIQIRIPAIRRTPAAGGNPGGIVTRPPGYSIRRVVRELDLSDLVDSGEASAAVSTAHSPRAPPPADGPRRWSLAPV
jgi:DNA-binding SARP family transcriptional activator